MTPHSTLLSIQRPPLLLPLPCKGPGSLEMTSGPRPAGRRADGGTLDSASTLKELLPGAGSRPHTSGRAQRSQRRAGFQHSHDRVGLLLTGRPADGHSTQEASRPPGGPLPSPGNRPAPRSEQGLLERPEVTGAGKSQGLRRTAVDSRAAMKGPLGARAKSLQLRSRSELSGAETAGEAITGLPGTEPR